MWITAVMKAGKSPEKSKPFYKEEKSPLIITNALSEKAMVNLLNGIKSQIKFNN